MEDLPLAQALPIGGTSADDQGQDQAQLHSWLQRLPAEVQASTKDAAFVQAGAHAMVLLTSGVPCTSPVGSDPHPVTTPNDAYLLPCGLPHHPT